MSRVSVPISRQKCVRPSLRVVIPARLASQRLPRKPLLVCQGKTLLQHVYEKAQLLNPHSIVIATDHSEIIEAANQFSAPTCLTRSSHITGTDRVAEVCRKLGYSDEDIVLILQADEPLMPVETLQLLSGYMQRNTQCIVATVCDQLLSQEELFDPNIVKVVIDKNQNALYFSRAPIPWNRGYFASKSNNAEASHTLEYLGSRDISHLGYLRHVGLYAYRVEFLKTYVNWDSPLIESAECLEQLRVLWNGIPLPVLRSPCSVPPGVDTPADFDRVQQIMSASAE